MSRKLLTSLFAVCGCVALAAQDPAPATSSSTSRDQAPAAAKADSGSITVAGCIQRSTATPSAAAGAVGTSGTASPFILANAAKPAADPTTTQAPAAASTTIASSYRLDADDSKVSPHVGHKVEITGTVDKAMGSTASASSGAASAPVLKVESVKMVAASCAP